MSFAPPRPPALAPDLILPRLSGAVMDRLFGGIRLHLVMVRRGFPSAVVYANPSVLTLLSADALPAVEFSVFCDRYFEKGDRAGVREAVDVGLARTFPVRLTLPPDRLVQVSLEVIPVPDERGLLSHCALVIDRPRPEAPTAAESPSASPGSQTDPTSHVFPSVLSAVYQQAPVGLALVDPSGRLSMVNGAFAEYLHLPATAPQIQPALQDVSPALALAARAPATKPFPISLPSSTGRLEVFELSLSAIPVGTETWQLLTLHDVRARDAAQASREETRRLESLGTFASGIAHDFNNLLTIILGYGGLIGDHADRSPSLARAAHAILDAGKRGADIVRQLQLFAHQHPPDLRRVDIRAVIEEAVGHAFPAPPDGITVVRDFTSRPVAMELDASQVLLGLRHLLQNGSDVMESGGTLTIRTEFIPQKASTVTDLPATLVVSIADQGPEMDESKRARLFDPFSGPQSRAGTRGLGLAVVYGIMRSHQGRIEVSSEPTRGNRIDLHFPCRAASVAALPAEPVATVSDSASGTVLIVEDEVDIGRLWEGLFASHGIAYRWARDGEEGLSLFHRHRDEIHLLFTDVGLPGMSGWDVARAIRELNPQLPILITSGAFQPNDRASSGLAEPLVCLSKPFFPSTVIQHVQRLIAAVPLTATLAQS